MNNYKWLALIGNYENDGEKIRFKGENTETPGEPDKINPIIGNYICDQYFDEGKIKMVVEFLDSTEYSGCDVILNYSRDDKMINVLCVGIDNAPQSLFEIKHFSGGKWNFYQFAGSSKSFKTNYKYEIEVEYIGSYIKMKVDGVEALNYRLPFTTHRSQVGIWNRGIGDIIIHDFEIEESLKPKAFIVMQFGDRFDELYKDIIKPICESFDLTVVRADDIYNNDMIISDITRNIEEAKVIIADISPKNLNVYYEVGYAHALAKNTILLCEEGTELPFDVKPYRVIFYKDSIGGKSLVEERLKLHLNSVMN